MVDAAERRAVRGGGAAARRDADRADAARPPAEDGDDRARPPRRVRPEARPGRRGRAGVPGAQRARRRARRARHRDGRLSARRDGEVLEAAIQQFYELRAAPPEVHVPAEPDDRDALETWLSERAGRARPHRRAAARREARAGRSREPQRRARLSDPLQPGDGRAVRRARDAARTCSRCRRCRAASSASTSRRSRAARPSRRWSSARTAGCGEAEYRKFRIQGLGTGGRAGLGRSAEPGADSPSPAESRAASPRRLRGDARSRAAPLPQAARAGRAVSGSDPDRRRQGTAVGGLRGARGARAREPGRGRASRRRRSCSSRATARIRSRWPRTIRRCCCCSASATKRTASR